MTEPTVGAERQRDGTGRLPLAAAVELLPAAVAVVDCELVCRYANSAAVRWFERADRQQVLGQPLASLIALDVASPHLQYTRAALAGVSQQYQRAAVGPDDRIRHNQISQLPLREPGGAVQGVVLLVVDVTERVAAEVAVRRQAEQDAARRERALLAAAVQSAVVRPLFDASLQLTATLQDGGGAAQQRVDEAVTNIDVALEELRRLLQAPVTAAAELPAPDDDPTAALTAEFVAGNLSDAVSLLDREGRYTWASPSTVWVTGWLPEQLVGRRLADFVHPEDQALVGARHAEVSDGASFTVREYRHRRPDGSYAWVEDTLRSFAGAGAGGATLIASTRDVGERRSLQEALAEASKVFELCFAAAPIGMALVGADGRWLKVNAALARITGRTEAQLLAGSFQQITHPDDLEADLHLLAEVTEGRRPGYSMYKRYLRRDGGIVWVQLNVAGVRHADGSLRFVISQIVEQPEGFRP